ncbi:hypothetical protein A7311_00995 [Paenibacillus polymyxa]|uniref:Rad52/Rad22 family DNA repair protein n=1 Tax=Paenibacillus polymyxa TaxID=1406 RepID=UPI00083E078A|nr:Rad52/Rad22 family DNA repair protein [Paenibacillus polymyxa]ODB56933.1 hypothetical protein A7311_00995 [Paenibacillus polymyxa]
MDANQIMKALQAPFPPDEIEWRVDRGQKTSNGNFVFVLVYVTNRAIMNRLDEIFGPTGWKNEFKEWKQGSQLCGISVKIGDEWITKWDGSDDSNMDAVKGGLSGAMKRAAVQWGIGRYLYKLDQNRIPLKERGENYANVKVKVSGGKDEYIKGYWDTPTLPEWALPEGFTASGKPQNPVVQSVVQDEPEPTTNNNSSPNNDNRTPTSMLISEAQVKYSHRIKNEKKISEEDFRLMIRQVSSGKESIKDLTKKEASTLINQLNDYPAGA